MANVSVTNHCRTVVQNLLANGVVGFQPTLNTICTGYGVTPYTINFAGTGRNTNFFTGAYGPKVLEETSNFKFPVMCLYVIKSQSQNNEKFRTFSGSIMLGLDVYLGFPKSSALLDTETTCDATDETLYNVFNTADNFSFYEDVIYNGELTITRSPVVLGANNWVQSITSKIVLDYNI